MLFEDLGLLFFTVLILSLLLTPASIRFARFIGAIDQPVNRSVHSSAMPRMGGVGMAVALLIGLLLFVPIDPVDPKIAIFLLMKLFYLSSNNS